MAKPSQLAHISHRSRSASWRRPILVFLTISYLTALSACQAAPATHVTLADPSSSTTALVEGEPAPAALPATLTGQLRAVDSNSDERVVILEEGSISAIVCTDCGPPVHEEFESVECQDGFTCQVATDGCRGLVSRVDSTRFEVSFSPVSAAATRACATLSGSFVPAPIVGTFSSAELAPERRVSRRPRVIVGQPTSAGRVDIARSRAVVQRNIGDLESCYDAALEEDDLAGGVVQLAVAHNDDRRMNLSSVEHSSFDEGEGQLELCVQEAFSNWTLPAPRGGGEARVYYSLGFVAG
jgi:hypothetical protein